MALPFVMDHSAVIILGSSAASIAAVGGYSIYARIKSRRLEQSEDTKDSIKQHVKHELRLGKTLPIIKQGLIRAGHDKNHVREVVGMLELYDYVYHNMKKGHNSVNVKNALLNWGWDESKVNEAIVHASDRLLTQKYSKKHVTV